ncbi:MAG: hypothetical protein WCP06_10375 [Verrucomicrobiota bacterium]
MALRAVREGAPLTFCIDLVEFAERSARSAAPTMGGCALTTCLELGNEGAWALPTMQTGNRACSHGKRLEAASTVEAASLPLRSGSRGRGGAWTRAWALALGLWAMWFSGAAANELKEVRVQTPFALNREAVFSYREPTGGGARAILLLVPGCNGDGRAFLKNEAVWGRFADQEHLVLVGPTFKTNLEEVHSRLGYYYPELWSGAVTLKALEQIRARTGAETGKALVFGFSAGAHFAHRFALWAPERVGAFVAYSAGWWDAPTLALRDVPGLILCGEADERYRPTYGFFSQGRKLGLPLIWRGYEGVGHELTPQVVNLAQAFLGFHARAAGDRAAGEKYVGDIQTYRFYPANADAAQRVPDELRVALPSREVAEVWSKEK